MSDTQITKYEVMFALHTGVTIMTPRLDIFDPYENSELDFHINTDGAQELVVSTPDNQSIVLKDFQRDYLAEAEERGFVMLYELNDEDEIVRCTPCQLKR